MRFLLYLKDARKTILANKMRSGLSTLGIVIGMASVIIMMAFGEGYKTVMLEQVGDMMKNTIDIYPGGGYSSRDEETGRPGSYLKRVDFTPETIEYIEKYFPSLSGKITYEINSSSDVKVGGKNIYFSYYAVPQNWFGLNEKEIEKGVGLSEKHYQQTQFVAVINKKFADDVFKKKSAIGQKIKIDKRDYTVIGILKATDEDLRPRGQGIAYIPSTTYFERVAHKNTIGHITVHLDTQEDNALWKNRITYLLLKKFNQKHKASASFHVGSNAEYAKQIDKITKGISTFLLVIGLISLIVGGIGVMNIMIVSVTERTREIGIRKAIGALNKDIVSQFLIESIVITFIGGFLALGFSYGATFFINKAFVGGEMEGMKAVINIQVVVIAFLLTALTGIVFGILPARKAAKLKPIDALRFE